MKNKILVFFIFNLLLFSESISNKYNIIIADDDKLRPLFQNNPQILEKIAQKITINNLGAVIHLGNRVIFDKGGDFYTTSSKENLKTFSKKILDSNKKLYFWIFDSYGNHDFLDTYNVYHDLAVNLKKDLDNLNIDYSGIVVDLEWVNLNTENDNSMKFIKLMEDLKVIFKDKEIKYFAPLIDSPYENFKRGYNEYVLNPLNIHAISMLYIKDGGFYYDNSWIYPYLNDKRINEIRKYLTETNQDTAIAFESGLIVIRNDNPYFIRNFSTYEEDFFKNMTLLETKEYEYYKIKKYKINNSTTIKRNDLVDEALEKDESVFIFETKKEILKNSDFIWEFFRSPLFNDYK